MRINILLIFTTLLLSSCGKTDKEIHDIAAITCSVISESKMIDSSFRVKEVNIAREKMELEPYLDGDKGIVESIKYGLCVDLVKNDPNYFTSLYDAKIEELRIENERLALIKEQQRLAEEREREQKRLAEEREREQKRLAEEREREQKKLAEERQKAIELAKLERHQEKMRNKKDSYKKWYDFLVKESKSFAYELIKIEYQDNKLALYVSCDSENVFKGQLITSFKGDENFISKVYYPSYCDNETGTSLHYVFLSKAPVAFKSKLPNFSELRGLIDNIYLSINSVVNVKNIDNTEKVIRLHPSSYPALSDDEWLDKPITIPVKL